MATMPAYKYEAPPVTIDDYLGTVYEPDCEYVNGRIEERNLGEYDHGELQGLVYNLFMNNRSAWGIKVVPEVRTQVRPKSFRIPDVSVLRANAPREKIITHPQLIAIEILSPEDRWSRLQEKIDDYLSFGVENIWILDPETHKAWTADNAGTHLAQDGVLTVPETTIRVVIGELYKELEQL